MMKISHVLGLKRAPVKRAPKQMKRRTVRVRMSRGDGSSKIPTMGAMRKISVSKTHSARLRRPNLMKIWQVRQVKRTAVVLRKRRKQSMRTLSGATKRRTSTTV
jgi:hypothetical protein